MQLIVQPFIYFKKIEKTLASIKNENFKMQKSEKKFLGPLVPASSLAALGSPIKFQDELKSTKKII